MTIPYPPDEAERLHALRAYDVLDTPPEASFDRLTRLAAAHFDVPISVVSLISEDEQFHKSCVGLDVTSAPRKWSFCTHALVQDHVMVVEDATQDPRFRQNPFVTGETHIRFYAGAQLRTPEGYVLGTLCLIDTTPRSFSADDCAMLADMAALVMDELELRRTAREMEEREQEAARAEEKVSNILESIAEGFVAINAEEELSYLNVAAETLLQKSRGDVLGRKVWEVFPEVRDSVYERSFYECVSNEASLSFEWVLPGTDTVLVVNMYPTAGGGATVYFQDVTAQRRTARRLRTSEKQLQEAEQMADVGHWGLDLATGQVHCSEGIVAMLHLGDTEVHIDTFFSRVHPDDRTRVETEFRDVMARERSYDDTFRFTVPDGGVVHVHVRSEVRTAPDGTSTLFGVTRDITAEVTARKAIKASEQRLAGILDSAMDAIITVNEAHRVVLFNQAAERMFGYTNEEISGAPLERLLPQRVQKEHDTRMHLFNETNEKARRMGESGRVYACRRNGEEFPAEASISRVTTPRGRLYTVILRDVTEQVESRRELEESEARYRSVVNSVQEVIFELDTNGHWRFVNPAWEALLGYSAEETIGRPFLDFVHPADRAACTEQFEAVMSGEQTSCQSEVRYTRVNGGTRWFEVNAWMMFDSAGHPKGISGTLYDLTERRAAEQTLRRAKDIADQLVEERTEQLMRTNQQLQQMATLVDHARDAIWVQDAEGHISYWNKSAETLYGWSWDEAVGATVQSLLHETGDTTYAEVRNQAHEQGAWSGELAHQTRSGRTVHVDSRWSRAAAHDASDAAFLVVNTDITERKDLEQQVRRAQRMESLGKLAGSVAHDVNNVLGPILMSLEMLETVATDDRSQRLIQALASGAERGAGLMRQLLSFARGSEGAPKVMPLGPVLDELKGMIGDTIPANIDATFTIAPDLHQVKGDATQLHQVFMNLVVNACDAMEDGGTLTVHAENVTIDANVPTHLEALPGAYVRVSVADTGPGMPPDVCEKIFDPFYTTKADGTGLGLSTTLGIVRGHHGFIDLDTEPGHGATFEVYLPVVHDEAGTDETVATPIPAANGKQVLLAEDEVGLRLVTKRVLEAHGYVVHMASNGAEAGRWLRGHAGAVDVVITDVMMPVVDGRGLLRIVQEVAPGVPVVAVSGLETRESMVQEEFPQVKAFLAKPYRADVLLRTLHEALTPATAPA